jgi:uroporphyrinogen decarboxylase
MTPRARLLTALRHEEPDKVPIDFGGHRSSGIMAIAYARLRQALGLAERPIRVYDPMQQLAVIDPDVLDRFEVDTIELGRGFALDDEDWHDWVLPDGTPCQLPRWTVPQRESNRWVLKSVDGRVVSRMPDGAIYFEQSLWPFLEEDNLDLLPEVIGSSLWGALSTPPGPLVSGPDGAQVHTEGAKNLRQHTNRGIIGLFGGNLLELGQSLYRMDNFLMLLASDPERAHQVLDRLLECHLANLDNYLSQIGDQIDVILFGDDFGMQSGPQISTAMHEEFFKPRQTALWRRAKELADVRVQLHCCGGVRPLLPHFIEAGLDAINPVQFTCTGMDSKELKADFGDQLTFWGGGCDTQQMLPHGTPDEIRSHVKRQFEIFMPGGGFVFQQVHNIQADVPPENIIAMFDAAIECRDY